VYDVKKEQKFMQVKFINNNILDTLQCKYHKAGNRLLLFDYDGTLTPIEKLPELAVLNEETKNILKNIISDPHNKVVIISGRKREFIEEQFKNLDAVLVAEHGFFIKYPDTGWESSLDLDLSWKDDILPLLNDYVDRCNGSMIEEKDASLVWHYRNADEEIAVLRINELKDDLSEILKNEPKLYVLEGDKVLEIKSILYDKGTLASVLINKEEYDFILAIGDDSTDEDLFKAVPEHGFTIKVGTRPTNASFNVKDQSQISGLLQLFAVSSKSTPG
jgi:trehalose 6-phosphate synthase/phosphatase